MIETMKRGRWIAACGGCCLLGAGVVTGANTWFQPEKGEDHGMAMEEMSEEEMMEMWMAANAPGPNHEGLERMLGTWDAEVRYRQSEDMPWTASKGRMVTSWAFEDNPRFTMGRFAGNMNGIPFQGISILGYSNRTGKYQTIWMDSMSTEIFFEEGTCNEDMSAFSYFGSEFNPFDGAEQHFVDHIVVHDDDHHSMYRHYVMPDGSSQMNFEINYTRAR